MKKILLALIAVVFVSSLCFAEEPSEKVDEVKTFTGKVEKITKLMGKPPKWIYCKIDVVSDSGEKTLIYVVKATAVTDTSEKDMTEGGKKLGAIFLKKGERIEVKYSTVKKAWNEATDWNEAISISCLD